jgi:hypothetical protein
MFNLVSFEYNGEFYIGMGADLDSTTACCGLPLPSRKFWKYNPNLNTWTRLADFPGSLENNQNYPTAFTIDSKAYVFYGAIPMGNVNMTTDFSQQFWEYNLLSNSWSQLSLPASGGPPPGEKYQIFSYNGKAYFVTAQRYVFSGVFYEYQLQVPMLEYDPLSETFKKFSFTNSYDIMKLVYRKGNIFYFQADALGYTSEDPNRTHMLILE